MNLTIKAQTIEWLARPLCARYSAVFVDNVSVLVREEGVVSHRAMHWAFGVLANGQCEVLGAWHDSASGVGCWPAVFEDLHARGVEQIRFVVGDERSEVQSAARTVFPGASVLRSPGLLLGQSLVSVVPRDRRSVGEAWGAIRDARTVQAARAGLADLKAGPWGGGHPAVVQRWRALVDELAPFYALPARVRTLVLRGDETAQQVAQALARAVARHGCFSFGPEAIAFVSEALSRVDRGLGAAGRVAGAAERKSMRRAAAGFAPAFAH